MSWEGWTLLGLLVVGMIGGLLLWTKFGSQGGHDV